MQTFLPLLLLGLLAVSAGASNEWRPQSDKNHVYLIKKMPPASVAKVIEDLMAEPPSGLRK